MRTLSYFFIRIKSYAHLAVFDFRMLHEVGYSGHNLSYPGFVIGAKQSMSVGDNQVLPHIVTEFGEA